MANLNPDSYEKPRWIRDLTRFLPLKSQYVLSGNVRDLQIIELGQGALAPVPLIDSITEELKSVGYEHVLVYNPIAGFLVTGASDTQIADCEKLLIELGLTPANGRVPAGLDLLEETLNRLVLRQGDPVALLVDFASRLVVRHDALSSAEHKLFSRALVLSHQAQARPYGDSYRPFYNTILWVVEKEGDLPDWLLIDNPKIRHIPIAKPDHRARRSLAPALLKAMPGAESSSPEDLQSAIQTFVDETDGLLLVDLKSITQLGKTEGVSIFKIADAVRRYKVGVTEDPWKNINRNKIREAEGFISQRLKGQTHAVTHVLDIIKRAITGVGTVKRSGRPRGVVFLAGPTGVGKTELAKTITSLLFGDESAYIRFDMSEFSAEHSDQRLIGAPPGYVGYDAGGELTNAIREKPFSVVLFDEIEKAHPRILDKFLQILDDGVLTSGRGDRVYFSEAFIVFTSNLGIYKYDQSGVRIPNVTLEDRFDAVQSKVLEEIDRHFKLVLNRPEILNRIGENIIVFDYIRPDIAVQIFDQIVNATLEGLSAQEITIFLSVEAREILKNTCLDDLSNGGRGIRNQIEANFVNPLARALFDANAQAGSQYEVLDLLLGDVTTVSLHEIEEIAE